MSPPVRFLGDELDLYGEFNHLLVQELMRDVRFTREIAEDAAAEAWIYFFRTQPDRGDGRWRGWLIQRAEREAIRLAALEPGVESRIERRAEPVDPHDLHEERLDFVAAMQELRRLPPHARAAVLLSSQVSTQSDVARLMRISRSRVAQLLAGAARRVASRGDVTDDDTRPPTPRAATLRDLQEAPPPWLTNAIGPCPQRGTNDAVLVLAWRRAALAIHDYRSGHRHCSATEAIGELPAAQDARADYLRAERAIRLVEQERSLTNRPFGRGC